ncbi:MAG TPA: YncE family protein [Candidatus Nitrosocosmicus sp.]
MSKNKGNRINKISSFNSRLTVILSAFVIFFLYLSNTFLFDDIRQAWANIIIDTIGVGDNPVDLSYDPVHQKMYVANLNSNYASVIDTTTNKVIKNITVSSPFGIAYDTDNREMYVTDFKSNSISIINPFTDTVVGSPIPVGALPTGIAYDPVHQRMYVANLNDNSVSVIDTTTNMVINTLTGFNGPISVKFNPINQYMYVTNYHSNTVSVIDSSYQDIATITVGNSPRYIAYVPNNQEMYVTNQNSSNVSIINSTNSLVDTINVGNGPNGIAYNSNNQKVYVDNENDNTISLIDPTTNTVVGSPIPDGNQPGSIAYNPINHDMYVSNYGSSDVSAILTPGQGIQKIIDTLNGMNISSGNTTNLESSLNNALKQINNNKSMLACNNLNAFINKVNEDQTTGKLTSQLATNLIQQAIDVQKAIGCSTFSVPLSSSNNMNNFKPFNDPMNGLTAGS